MTGKEALEKLLNTLKHWQGRNTIFDKMQGDCILEELELLDKYKRAFEIFKRLNGEHLPVFFGIGIIAKEEYELLEELMKDD